MNAPATQNAAAPLQTAIEGLTGAEVGDALRIAGVLVLAAGIGFVVHAVAFAIAKRAAARTPLKADDILVTKLRGPLRIILPSLALQFAIPSLGIVESVRQPLRHGLSLLLILAVTWLVIQLVRAGAQVVMSRFDVEAEDNLEARRVHTQLLVLTRIVGVVAAIIGVGVALTTFPAIRQLGASILASAGIAGLVVGLAAQRVLANFIAGLQIAFTEPIHLDDVVVIDGEWGRIEEVTTTYVVLKIWDERRLIVPFSRFIDQPFANWTRTKSQILGTVFLYADYTLPIEPLREELRRIVEASPNWDKRVCGLVVSDARPDTLELRALVSAHNGSKAWDLRCEVREQLVRFLQREFPESLPHSRVVLERRPGGVGGPEGPGVGDG